MSDRQREAMTWMSQRNVGAMPTRRGWTWRVDVRTDPDAAEAVMESVERMNRERGTVETAAGH